MTLYVIKDIKTGCSGDPFSAKDYHVMRASLYCMAMDALATGNEVLLSQMSDSMVYAVGTWDSDSFCLRSVEPHRILEVADVVDDARADSLEGGVYVEKPQKHCEFDSDSD